MNDGQLRHLPAEGGRGRRQNRYFTTTDDEKGLGGSPMSPKNLLALVVCHPPQFDGDGIRPSDELPQICRVELEAGDAIAAIFSNVSFTVTALRLSPADRAKHERAVTYGPSGGSKFSLLFVRR